MLDSEFHSCRRTPGHSGTTSRYWAGRRLKHKGSAEQPERRRAGEKSTSLMFPAADGLSMAEQGRRAQHDGNRQKRQAGYGPLPELPVRSLQRGADDVAPVEGRLHGADDVSCGDMRQAVSPMLQR